MTAAALSALSSVALAGFLTSLSLIVAIGAQNAFVLRQGLLRRHVFAVCAFCGLSDALLIGLGVAGAGRIAERAPWAMELFRWTGAAFLVWYGARSFRAAWQGTGALEVEGAGARGLAPTLATIAALTWLNPHVYLDTLMLVGAVSARFPAKGAFAAGAIAASIGFFFALGYGARLLAPGLRPAAGLAGPRPAGRHGHVVDRRRPDPWRVSRIRRSRTSRR